MRLDELWRGQAQNNRPHVAAAVQPSPVMVQVETNVLLVNILLRSCHQALTDMGFPRQRVEQALVRTNNDLDQATNILLNDF